MPPDPAKKLHQFLTVSGRVCLAVLLACFAAAAIVASNLFTGATPGALGWASIIALCCASVGAVCIYWLVRLETYKATARIISAAIPTTTLNGRGLHLAESGEGWPDHVKR